MNELLQWFAGGRTPYMNLVHCMNHDMLWIWITVALDLAVAAGYALIAYHWWTNARHLPKIPAKAALANMRNIFVFCGICGYAFIPIKMVWPAWRLYDIFLAVLVYFTWKYAWNAKDLKVVYHELGRAKQLQDDLEKSKEESRRKSLFLNALSHDLRTPLNGMMLQIGYAELSLKKNADPAVVAEALVEIKNCTRATSELLDSLLEYAKVDWSDSLNTTQTFELDELLESVVARVRPAADAKGIYLRHTPTRGTRLMTDRVKLDRILSNLLGNAVKFTNTGGVRVETEVGDAGVEIHVIDTGVGIEPATRDQLFQEFFQVHNHERDPRKGFGLGLAIARRLARQLDGEILVDSSAGNGSRFTVVLPNAVSRAGTVVGDNGRSTADRESVAVGE